MTELACSGRDGRIAGPSRGLTRFIQWTRNVAAKTVTVTLTQEQAARCKEWSRNMRTFDRVLTQIQDVGLRAARLLCKGR